MATKPTNPGEAPADNAITRAEAEAKRLGEDLQQARAEAERASNRLSAALSSGSSSERAEIPRLRLAHSIAAETLQNTSSALEIAEGKRDRLQAMYDALQGRLAALDSAIAAFAPVTDALNQALTLYPAAREKLPTAFQRGEADSLVAGVRGLASQHASMQRDREAVAEKLRALLNQ